MTAGHVYVVFTTLARPPKDKLTLCLCAAEGLFFWINSNPNRSGIGQFQLGADDHSALTKACFLDCSRVTKFRAHELQQAKPRGVISTDLASRIVAFLQADPPRTVPKRFIDIAVTNLSTLV